MSSQAPFRDILLQRLDPQQNLRLLELPTELLDLLTGPSPPRLYFKSSSSRTSNYEHMLMTPTSKAAENLHLCTHNQAYQVRQVSTSNSVYITEPSKVPPASRVGDEVTELDNTLASPSSAITAIAKVDTMLELFPISHDVKPMLERLLPLYEAPETCTAEEAILRFLSHSTPESKSALFSEIPAPDSQSEQAWRDLLAFELQGRCARPSALTALSVWQSIVNYTTLDRLHLAGYVKFKALIQNEQASLVHERVAEALLFYLQDRALPNTTAHSMLLDRSRTVSWTGVTLLQTRSENPDSKPRLLKYNFISQWQDLLPETWREDATLDKLPETCYMVEVGEEGKEMVIWNGLDGSGSGPAATTISEEPKATSGKRKWHEKFKAQRKETKK